MANGITLRQRIILTLLPLFVLLAVLGGAGMWLLHQLGGSIGTILRENYDSVVAMQDLKEALERIDSSFQFRLVAQGMKDSDERTTLERTARIAFEENWRHYETALSGEKANVTIHPVEDELVKTLDELTSRYRTDGQAFFQRAESQDLRHEDYYGEGRLYDTFRELKKRADEILQINQHEMKAASQSASRAADSSLIWLSTGFGLAIALAVFSAWQTIRTILQPIKAVQEAALGITAGNLDQVVPVFSLDELGQLAGAFNVMAHHLRDYRQSQSAHLLRAQRTSQAAIDSFPDAILVIDSDGRVEMANPEARKTFGVAIRSPDQPALGVWNPPEALQRPLDEALLGQRNFLPEGFDQIILLGDSPHERAFLPRILTIRDPEHRTLGAAVMLQDVTRLRLMDQVKSNLVATASHELKTPLTSIRLAVHLLLEDSVGVLNTKQTELVLDARENCERLLAVVNNLLDLARLEQGSRQLDLQPTKPLTLLLEAAEAVRVRAQDKNIQLTVDASGSLPPVDVDGPRIGHALGNLIDNAIACTDGGGKIDLSASASGEFVILSIKDTGCGISAEYLPHIFEKFYRVPGQDRGGGTGLGLAIVHEIVMAHGGTIDCESQPSVGTTFRIRLPIARGQS